MNDEPKKAPRAESNRKRRGRHEGSVYRRKDARWCARAELGISDQGQRRQAQAYGSTKQEALKKLAEKIQRPQAAASVRDQKLKDFLASYFGNGTELLTP